MPKESKVLIVIFIIVVLLWGGYTYQQIQDVEKVYQDISMRVGNYND